MSVNLKQITSVCQPTPSGGSNIFLFALDENGQLWQWMRGKWGMIENPKEKEKATTCFYGISASNPLKLLPN